TAGTLAESCERPADWRCSLVAGSGLGMSRCWSGAWLPLTGISICFANDIIFGLHCHFSTVPAVSAQVDAFAEDCYAFGGEELTLAGEGRTAGWEGKFALAVDDAEPREGRAIWQMFECGADIAGVTGIARQLGNLAVAGNLARWH